MATELETQLLDYANQTCRRKWTEDDLPAGVKLWREKAILYLNQTPGLQQKRLGDASWTYSTEWPKTIADMLKPYRKVKVV